ncbi:MAG TPA: CBS domain-containing protein, partial [Ramlibacter sp.]
LAKSPPLAVPGTAGVGEAIAAMEKAGVRRLLVVDPDGGVVGILSADDLLRAVAEQLGMLSRALGANIEREKSTRDVLRATAQARPVLFPTFGALASQ